MTETNRPQRGQTIKVTCEGESITGEVVSVMDVPPSPLENTDKETVMTAEIMNSEGAFMVDLDYPGSSWQVVE